jgi:hypothetical protein
VPLEHSPVGVARQRLRRKDSLRLWSCDLQWPTRTGLGPQSVIALAALLAALPIEVGFSAGPAVANDAGLVTAPMLRVRVGVELIESLSLNATLLGAAGSEPSINSCAGGSDCLGRGSLRAISGLASLRLRSSGDEQGFVELGAGVGHLIILSPNDQFENPSQRGRGGFSYLIAGGVRWFVSRKLALGLSLEWTAWSHVEQPAHYYGIDLVPAQSGLSAGALALMFSINLAPFR